MNTEQITCPVCGKQHTVQKPYKVKNLHLDATPIEPVVNRINAYTICDCGMLCFNAADEVYKPQEMIQDMAYQQVLLREDLDINEKKLMLMYTGLFDKTAPLLLAHYCAQPEKRKRWMEIALFITENAPQSINQQLSGAAMPAMKINARNNPFMGRWFYTAQHQRVDLLRQLGKLEEAKKELDALVANRTILPAEQHFLNTEKRLIEQKNTSLQ